MDFVFKSELGVFHDMQHEINDASIDPATGEMYDFSDDGYEVISIHHMIDPKYTKAWRYLVKEHPEQLIEAMQSI